MPITAIERQPRRRRVNVFVDGRFALALSLEVLGQSGLRVGDELGAGRLEELREAEARHAIMAAALRLLSYRPRSDAELRQRLARRGASPALVDETIGRLQELGLVDDAAFARSWVERREQASPRGRRLLAWELHAKGVAAPLVKRSLTGLDDEAAALRAASRRAPAMAGLPYSDFRRRLSGFLLRRGFAYETVRRTVARLWEEVTGSRPEAEGDQEAS